MIQPVLSCAAARRVTRCTTTGARFQVRRATAVRPGLTATGNTVRDVPVEREASAGPEPTVGRPRTVIEELLRMATLTQPVPDRFPGL